MKKILNEKTIKESILEKIKGGDIKKLSRSYFFWRGFIFVLSVTLLLIFLVFIVSFMFFCLRVSGLSHLSQFGTKGVELLFSNLPWLLVTISILLIILLEGMTRRFSFVYKRPLIYSAFLIIIIVIVGNLIVKKVALHEKIYNGIENGDSVAIKNFYDGYSAPNPDIFHPGTILDLTKNGFILENRDKTSIKVKVSSSTQIRPKLELYKGNRLLVIGKIINNQIEAVIIDNAPLSGRP